MYPKYMFEQKYENSKKKSTEIVIFTAVKYRCILHGRVFIMDYPTRAMEEKENKERNFIQYKRSETQHDTIHIDRYKVLHIMLCLLSSPRVLVKVATL